MITRERRLLLLALICALAAGLLTFRQAQGRAGGPPQVDVLVSRSDLAAGAELTEERLGELELRRLPAASRPPDALSDPLDALGRSPRIDLPAGSLITQSVLSGAPGEAETQLRRGERAIVVEALVQPEAEALEPGRRVDLLASGLGGSQQSVRVLNAAEVLAMSEGEGQKRRLTLRLASAQAARVVEADVFARELRALIVPEGRP